MESILSRRVHVMFGVNPSFKIPISKSFSKGFAEYVRINV